MPSPESIWRPFEEALAALGPDWAGALATGAAEADLEALETVVGQPLTPDARAYFAGHNGQTDGSPGLFFGLRLLSTRDVAREWGLWDAMRRDDPSLATSIAVTSEPEGTIAPVYLNAGWLPLTADGAGNHLALDLAPGPTGTRGQVIVFGADETAHVVVVPSIALLPAWCAARIDAGDAAIEDDAAAPGGRSLRLRGAGHPFDVLREVLRDGARRD